MPSMLFEFYDPTPGNNCTMHPMYTGLLEGSEQKDAEEP